MISITSKARFRQRVIRYSEKHGVTEASIRHRVSRKAMPVRTVDGNDYVAVVSIPSIDRSLPVYNTWNYVNLRSAPCRFSGSVYTNDLIICAHNYVRHFGLLKNLAIGDEVSIIDMNGNVFKYAVTEVETLGGREADRMTNSKDWDLTLFTCTIGGVSRVTVRCCRVG